VKFNFSLSELRKQPYFAKNVIVKCQILEVVGEQAFLPTPMLIQ